LINAISAEETARARAVAEQIIYSTRGIFPIEEITSLMDHPGDPTGVIRQLLVEGVEAGRITKHDFTTGAMFAIKTEYLR
jgi:hypothetical protein